MNTVWNLGRACLLLLGLILIECARVHAGDIQLAGFDNFTTSSASASAGEASAGPFQEEAPVSKGISSTLQMPEDTFSSPCYTEMPCGDDCFMGAPGRFWFQGEYMLWWTNGAHLPPMVSTQTANGALETVFGGRTIRDGDHDGYRINMGMWLDCCHCWGVEGEYFDFSGRPDNYNSGLSNGYDNGTYFPIVRALFDPNSDPLVEPENPQISGIGFPDTVGHGPRGSRYERLLPSRRGFGSVATSKPRNGPSQDGDVPWTDSSARTFRLDAVSGYRFTRLIDGVSARDDEMDVNPASLNLWTEYTNVYNYRATNNFNGWELGLDAAMTRGRWSLDALAKAAIGVNNQDFQYFNLYRAIADQSVAQTWHQPADSFAGNCSKRLLVDTRIECNRRVSGDGAREGHDRLRPGLLVGSGTRREPNRRAHNRLSLRFVDWRNAIAQQPQSIVFLGTGTATWEVRSGSSHCRGRSLS